VNAELRAELRRLRCELERLRVENEVLHEAARPLVHQAPAHERFAFILRLPIASSMPLRSVFGRAVRVARGSVL